MWFISLLLVATFLCALVAGFLFAFAIVVMPGIKTMTDEHFIRAFQSMDRVIQNNQPVFLLVWIGSAVTLIVAYAIGFGRLETENFWLMTVCVVTYLFGVHAPTVIINLPLNSALQSVNLDAADRDAQLEARRNFERRWNRSNNFRTCVSCVVAVLLMVVLLRL